MLAQSVTEFQPVATVDQVSVERDAVLEWRQCQLARAVVARIPNGQCTVIFVLICSKGCVGSNKGRLLVQIVPGRLNEERICSYGMLIVAKDAGVGSHACKAAADSYIYWDMRALREPKEFGKKKLYLSSRLLQSDE